MCNAQVWSGLMGRMPKRGMLASMPPAPHLTGNLFMLDLANIDHGWAMLPARAVQAGTEVGLVPPRKWAAMTSLADGAPLHRIEALAHERAWHCAHCVVASMPASSVLW